MKHITIILASLMMLSTQVKADNLTLVCNLEYFEKTFSSKEYEYMFTEEAVISFDAHNIQFLKPPALWDINRSKYCRLNNDKKMVRAIVSETKI